MQQAHNDNSPKNEDHLIKPQNDYKITSKCLEFNP